jgi:hypothetical protein
VVVGRHIGGRWSIPSILEEVGLEEEEHALEVERLFEALDEAWALH